MALRKRIYHQFSLDWKLLEENGYASKGFLHCWPKLKCAMSIITITNGKLGEGGCAVPIGQSLRKFFPIKQ